MKNTTITIIVPVHNVEKYLEKCLESIINQTYSDLEIILINDSSTDNSEKICKEYCLKDNRIKLYNNNSGSAGMSRNFGLEKANGRYVIFVDSDDYIKLDTCEKLYRTIKENNSDVCFCGYNNIKESKQERIYNNSKEIINYDEKEIRESLILKTIYVKNNKNDLPLYAVWNGIYDLEIIKNNSINFLDENIIFSEDSVFNYEYLSKCNRATIINNNLYNHTLYNNNSICSKYSKRYNHIDDWYNYILQKSNNKDTSELKKALQERYITFFVTKIKQEILLSGKGVIETIKNIKRMLKSKVLEETIKNINLKNKGKKQKIFLILIKYKLVIPIYVLTKIRKK